MFIYLRDIKFTFYMCEVLHFHEKPSVSIHLHSSSVSLEQKYALVTLFKNIFQGLQGQSMGICVFEKPHG